MAPLVVACGGVLVLLLRSIISRANEVNVADRCDLLRIESNSSSILPREALRRPWVLTGAMDRAVMRHAPAGERAFVARFGALITGDAASPPRDWASVHHERWFIREPPTLSAAIRMRIEGLRPLRDALEDAVPFLAWARRHGFGRTPGDGGGDGTDTLVPVLSAGASGEKLGAHRHDASYHLQVHGSRLFQLASPAFLMEELVRDAPCSTDADPPAEADLGDPCAVRLEEGGDRRLRSNDDASADGWWADVAAGRAKAAGACALREGDILFVPGDWWHSVCHTTAFSWGLSILDASRYEGVPDHFFRWERDGKCESENLSENLCLSTTMTRGAPAGRFLPVKPGTVPQSLTGQARGWIQGWAQGVGSHPLYYQIPSGTLHTSMETRISTHTIIHTRQPAAAGSRSSFSRVPCGRAPFEQLWRQ